jgi:hypothetical protein
VFFKFGQKLWQIGSRVLSKADAKAEGKENSESNQRSESSQKGRLHCHEKAVAKIHLKQGKERAKPALCPQLGCVSEGRREKLRSVVCMRTMANFKARQRKREKSTYMAEAVG